MKKKVLLIIALVLVVGAVTGGWWYMNRPVPLAEEPEDDVIVVNTEPEPEETPEPEEDPEDDHFGEIFYNEETGRLEFVDGSGPVFEEDEAETADPEDAEQPDEAETAVPENADQPQEPQPQPSDNGGEQGRELTPDEIRQKIANNQPITQEELDRLLDEAGISYSHGEDMPREETRPDDVRLDPNYVPPRIYW